MIYRMIQSNLFFNFMLIFIFFINFLYKKNFNCKLEEIISYRQTHLFASARDLKPAPTTFFLKAGYFCIPLTLVILNIFCTTLLPNFYLINLQHSSCKHAFEIRVENSVDPDQMASSTAFRKRINTTMFESHVDYLAFVRSRHNLH